MTSSSVTRAYQTVAQMNNESKLSILSLHELNGYLSWLFIFSLSALQNSQRLSIYKNTSPNLLLVSDNSVQKLESFAICNIYVVIVLSSFLFSRTKRYIQVGTRRTGHDDCLLHMPQKGGTVPLGFSWTHLNHHRNGDISYPIANQSGY